MENADVTFVSVSVADSGIGMSLSQMDKIFEPFYCGYEQRHLNPQGVGLGLAISRMICRKLGGDMKVES